MPNFKIFPQNYILKPAEKAGNGAGRESLALEFLELHTVDRFALPFRSLPDFARLFCFSSGFRKLPIRMFASRISQITNSL